MAEAEEVPDFVHGDRFDIEPIRVARGGGRPLEDRIEEHVRLDQLAGLGVNVCLHPRTRSGLFVGLSGHGLGGEPHGIKWIARIDETGSRRHHLAGSRDRLPPAALRPVVGATR